MAWAACRGPKMPLKRRGRPAGSANPSPQPPGRLLFALSASLDTMLRPRPEPSRPALFRDLEIPGPLHSLTGQRIKPDSATSLHPHNSLGALRFACSAGAFSALASFGKGSNLLASLSGSLPHRRQATWI